MKPSHTLQILLKTIALLVICAISNAQTTNTPPNLVTEGVKSELTAPPIESSAKPALEQTTSADKTTAAADNITTAPVTSQLTQASKPYSGRIKLTSVTGAGVSRTAGDEYLRVVSRGNTGAGLALGVFTSILSGGLNAAAFKKENLHGTKVDTIKHPAFTGLKTQIEAAVDAYLENPNNKKPAQFKNALFVEANQLLLVYSNLTGDTTGFELRAVATVSKKAESAGFFTGAKSIPCSFATPEAEALPLEKWEANNYALVKEKLSLFEAACAKEFGEKISTLLAD